MRFVAIATSIGALALYGALCWRDPVYKLLAPRGGVFTLLMGLLFANVLIWLSAQDRRTPNDRFQFALAGWIWLLVQVGGLFYELHIASGASSS